MLKIGVGPSSSHTLGPWRAAQRWISELKEQGLFNDVTKVQVDLYGSLSLTGKGHSTDIAVVLGLSGTDPVTIPVQDIQSKVNKTKQQQLLSFGGVLEIPFIFSEHIVFNKNFLPFHSNGIRFTAYLKNNETTQATYYSIGGGFVISEARTHAKLNEDLKQCFPFPVDKASELLLYCDQQNKKISEIVLENEISIRSEKEVDDKLKEVWKTMLECMYTGCHTEGNTPWRIGGSKTRL